MDSEEDDDEMGVSWLVALLLVCPVAGGISCPADAGAPGSSLHVYLNISHPVFSAATALHSGLVYQVWVRAAPGVVDYGLFSGGECIFSGPGPPANFSPPATSTNITFRITYRLEKDPTFLELATTYQISQECDLEILAQDSGNLSSSDIPHGTGCILRLPQDQDRTGLIVSIIRLNVPCSQGSLRLLPDTELCGKLEEIPEEDRQLYFPSGPPEIRIVGSPAFSISYRRVDPCYNVTMKGRNASVELSPSRQTDCTYNIMLPYGYRVSYTLQIGKKYYTSLFWEPLAVDGTERGDDCPGLGVTVWDGDSSWGHCATEGGLREVQAVSSSSTLKLRVLAAPDLPSYPSLIIRYEAVGDPAVVGNCPWPGVASQILCLFLSTQKLPWMAAESTCADRGGHLASISNQREQDLIDTVILNSPDYRDDLAYWVGGNDMRIEGDFRWSDSMPFAYTNWFPGWRGERNKQPNDDGFSGQDCLELRRLYTHSSGATLTASYQWNDRDCATPNYYICEALPNGDKMPSEKDMWRSECNRTLTLTMEEPVTVVTSPGFPDHYPDDTICLVTINAPSAFTVLVEFEELVLEKEPTCSYDYVEVSGSNGTKKLCGDWSDRLKLLRQVFTGPKLMIKFVSDYSHHFTGFKARVSVGHTWPECGNDKLWPMFNNSCYLVVSYPEVSWGTANKICQDIKGELASVHSPSEDRFIVTKIRESLGYSTSAIYWLGGRHNGTQWLWGDLSNMDFTGWATTNDETPQEDELCLGLQYMKSPSADLSSGLYWSSQPCDMVGGYICKKKNQGVTLSKELNMTMNGTEGRLTSPGYPEQYPIGTELWSRLEGPPGHRLVLNFLVMDLEHQPDCLYDWILLDDPPTRLCGHYDKEQLQKLHVVTTSNSALLHFHSDYSVSGGGFALEWHAVDVTGCPLQTTTAKQGELVSPNYPYFLLSGLDCSTTILAPEGKRVWLEVEDWELPKGGLVVDVGGGAGRLVPYSASSLLSEGSFASAVERMQVTLRTGDNPKGRGYRATYKTVGTIVEERVVQMTNVTVGFILHLNYPLEPPPQTNYTLRLIAPIGYVIHLQFHEPPRTNGVEENTRDKCSSVENLIEVIDPYADNNGSIWLVCLASLPLTFSSYLNSLRVKQIYGNTIVGMKLNATVTVKKDPAYKLKLKNPELPVESCNPNPCQNGGKCLPSQVGKHSCQCSGHFTGLLCGLTFCETEPCQFGDCSLTPAGYKCHCQPGYLGRTCDILQKPCSSNPCDSRGECIETNRTAFKCRCHAWWEGPRCERRMLHIPYKPLSERMLQEPFWLGLITVTVVLAILGLFWCAKRHFPEKLEKLLAEENDRNRPYLNGSRCASLRCRDTQPQPLVSRNSLLGRLGIRKPSLPAAPTSRTFSLDDLLKPPTTPSPRKKRNNSTPVKKSCASEKKQILQQLVSPVTAPPPQAPQETIPLATNNKTNLEPSTSSSAETSFTAPPPGRSAAEINSKLEKKVTFARLLDKVSSEMSSGSELEVAPAANSMSPNSTSSQQGSDSRSSSETQLHVGAGEGRKGRKTASADSILAMFRNFSGVTGTVPAASPSTTPTGSTPRDEVAGSDDSSTNTPLSSSSGIADSPPLFTKKTTIQVSVLDPLSAQKTSNSLQPCSLLQPPTILLEVPNKCLSPIRELPTPIPSPALTPVMARHNPMALLSPLPYKGQQSLKLDLNRKEDDNGIVIPVVRVEAASPGPGSPPPHRSHKPYLKDLDKPNSLDLPCPPPIITVTCSMTEGESDADSPAAIKTNSAGMCYLSPFSMCTRNDRTTSESNLSSSGYSSMASPGPSRCGSSNPLCPTDVEDNHHIPRRPSPLLRAPSCEEKVVHRGRSDSETMSDDPQLESNDEGFGTDQLEEKIEEGELKSAKELEVFLEDCNERAKLTGLPPPGNVKHCSSFDTGLENCKPKIRVKHCTSVEAGLDCFRITPPPVRHCGSADDSLNKKVLLQLPSIVVDGDLCGDKHISPVSSRSESPLSDKTGLGRFSPMFYGRMTDSDGLYDCGASSDCCKKKNSSRRRERRRSKSPTKISQVLLEVPGKNGVHETVVRGTTRTKPSPKRRVRPQFPSSTSSSSAESLNSIRDVTICLSPEKRSERLSGDNHWSGTMERQEQESGDEGEDVTTQMLPNEGDFGMKSQRKISKMRTVGHQIRFLRRLEQSLKRSRARVTSPERPLLPSSNEPREPRIAKRLSWLRARGVVSDGTPTSNEWDMPVSLSHSGHTD
nr:uncharacterized protein LOC106687239 isoform X2 [Halyomorpha halys]